MDPRDVMSPSPGDGRSPDVAEALSRLEGELGGPDAVREIVRLWIDGLPALLDALRTACAVGDGVAVRDTAHRLKSTSALLGGTTVRDVAQELEDHAAGADVATLTAGVERLVAAATALRAALEAGA